MQSTLNVYKGTPRTNATRKAWCYAVHHARNATQSNVTAVVVCCLQMKQVRTVYLSIWEWVEGNLCKYTVF